MSAFLDSILDSIDGKASSKPSAKVDLPRVRPPINTPASSSAVDVPTKRKAETDLNDTAVKAQRKETSSYAGTGPKAAYTGSRPKQRVYDDAVSTKHSAKLPRPPEKVTARQAVGASVNGSIKKPVTKPVMPQSNLSAPPKKNSYAEIMARAQKQTQSGAVLGAITHKPQERLTLAQRKAKAEEEALKKRTAIPSRSRGKPSRSQSPIRKKSADSTAQKPGREPINLGYKGTMRAGPPSSSYKGTMRGSAGSSIKPSFGSNDLRKNDQRTRTAGNTSYDEDDSDEMEDDWDDLSDMEAGMDELEEEEFESGRQARREDLQAQREEEEHRRKKLERRNRF